jgi:hypothetical protein
MIKKTKSSHKPPIRVELDGRIFDSLAAFGDDVLSAISEIVMAFKDMVVRFFRRH